MLRGIGGVSSIIVGGFLQDRVGATGAVTDSRVDDHDAKAKGGQGLPWMGRMPAAYITAELPPTAQRLLVAAQHILVRDGYPGLTLRRIAEEAGENKSLVVYHFESKAGLLAALVDSLWHDVDVELFHRLEQMPSDSLARTEALVDAQHRLALLTEQYRMYFELLPACARDKATRERLAQLNGLYRQLGVSCLAATGLPAAELEPLAGVLLAINDGIAALVQLVPQVDHGSVYRLMKELLGVSPREADLPTQASAGLRTSALAAEIIDPHADLAPVARNLVRGAVRLLRRRGFAALTMEGVAAEAGEPRSAITYYFGDKRGLVLAVHAGLLFQMRRSDERRLERLRAGVPCADAFAAALAEALDDRPSYRAFFDILPEILRDPELRAQHEQYDLWLLASLAGYLQECGMVGSADRSEPLAVLTLAATDGLAGQRLLEPASFDPRPAVTALYKLVEKRL